MTVTQSNLGQAPEPSAEDVAAAFGGDTASVFEQIRRERQMAPVGSSMEGSVAVTPPDPNILAVLRLFLEKYETLAEEDRKLYRGVIAMAFNPLMVVGWRSS